MNNFQGKTKEYPQVSIDYFESKNFDCCAFFLSHCHSDHMQGLDKQLFFKKLKRSSARLYTSDVTKSLLISSRKYKHLEPFIVTLTVCQPNTVCLTDGKNPNGIQVMITALQAGHCPGSVMFFFEGEPGNVLYTGDFRLTANDWPRMNSLFAENSVKTIDNLYIDTTFCKPSAKYLPVREESRDAIFALVDQWFAKSPRKAIYISCPAQYGTEYIFVELSKRYRTKVHVSPTKFELYLAIPDILDYVTIDGNNTRIHACYSKDLEYDKCKSECRRWSALPCMSSNKEITWDDILVIRPSTMWFDHHITANDIVHRSGKSNFYRVLYSMHSSLSEILDAVDFLKPRKIHPIVIPTGLKEYEVVSMLKKAIPDRSEEEIPPVIPEDDNADILYGSQNTYYTSSSQVTQSSEGEWDSDLIENQDVEESRETVKRKFEYDFDDSLSLSPESAKNASLLDAENKEVPSDNEDNVNANKKFKSQSGNEEIKILSSATDYGSDTEDGDRTPELNL